MNNSIDGNEVEQYPSDGRLVAVSALDRHAVWIWDVENDQEYLKIDLQTGVPGAVAFSPDGGSLALTVAGHDAISLIDVKNRRLLDKKLARPDPSKAIWGLAWSPDGHYLAAASDDDTAHVWNVAAEKEVLNLRGHSSDVKSVAWSPHGDQLATASLDGTLRLWSFPNGKLTAVLTGHSSGVRGVAWSPDGRKLASAGEDGTEKIFAAKTEDLLALALQQQQVGLTAGERDRCMALWQHQ